MTIEQLGLAGLPQNEGLGPLKRRYTMPPFSTWDTRQGDWMDRRRLWLARGMRSEQGRDDKLTFNIPMYLKDGSTGNKIASQTSIFDPVLCELAYRWFCPDGGVVVDPFAGGSVRGCVGSILGYKYFGVELRPEQVAANKAQVEGNPALSGQYKPLWVCGDSLQVFGPNGLNGRKPPTADMVLSCPPYGNLEVYSDDPADISNCKTFDDFLVPYGQIIRGAVECLRPDRFAVWVVGNYRDERGMMLDFKGATIRLFEEAGMRFYNDIILINSIGSGAMRANNTFNYRKMVKCHQDVLVFCKGNPKSAAEAVKGPEDEPEKN